MTRAHVKLTVKWGFFLWLVGYVLGIVLFPLVSSSLIGWIILPIGILVTLWVLVKKIHVNSLQQYFVLAGIWVIIAVLCDYFFLVKLFKPEDGYYKLDVYVYYALTFILPILIGVKRTMKS